MKGVGNSFSALALGKDDPGFVRGHNGDDNGDNDSATRRDVLDAPLGGQGGGDEKCTPTDVEYINIPARDD